MKLLIIYLTILIHRIRLKMSYKVMVDNKEFIVSEYVLKFEKCVITNFIKYNSELIFDKDKDIFENFVLIIVNGSILTITEITNYMQKLYDNDFDSVINYINFDVIPLLTYFNIYKKTNLRNHVESLNNLDNYLCGIYQMRILLNTIKLDLSEFSSKDSKTNNKITTFIYHNLSLRENVLLDNFYSIVENIINESKSKCHIQLLQYTSNNVCHCQYKDDYSELYCNFYSELVNEIKKIDDEEDQNYLYKWIEGMSSDDYENYKAFEKESDLKHEIIVELIKKYNISNQYQLFGYPFIDPDVSGITYFRCIAIVLYSDN